MIELIDVSKRFQLFPSPVDRFRHWLGLGGRLEEFWALSRITFAVPNGRTLGIIGPNGAGKSTLLKLITGTLVPTSGDIRVRGRVAALLELGTGFHPEFTGRQNIRLNAQLLGLTHDEIAEHEEEIIRFSELGFFIDQPLRTYSSGMYVRLGFAIAASVNPDVLIVDEALAVGDARFSQKCLRRIRQFREAGTTILFVSHDPGAVATLCDEALLLHQGREVARGRPADVLEEYNGLIAQLGEGNVEMRVHRTVDPADAAGARRSGTFQAFIREVEMLDARGRPTSLASPGETVAFRVRVEFLGDCSDPTVGILIKDRLGLEIFGTNTRLRGVAMGDYRAGDAAEVRFDVELRLGHGDYSVTAAVHQDETHLDACYDWADRIESFRVRHADLPTWKGIAMLEPTVRCERIAGDIASLGESLESVFGSLGTSLPLDPAQPSPFLTGFHYPERGADDWFRWLGPKGTFVARIGGPTLEVDVCVAPLRERGLAPSLVALRRLGGAEILRCPVDSDYATLRIAVSEELLGRLTVWELEVSPTFTPESDNRAGSAGSRQLSAIVLAVRSPAVESLVDEQV